MTTPGEIYLIDFGKTVGHEQGGVRPSVIFAVASSSELQIVIPLTTNKGRLNNFPHTHLIHPSSVNGLKADSVALVFQVTSASDYRVLKKIGKLDDPES